MNKTAERIEIMLLSFKSQKISPLLRKENRTRKVIRQKSHVATIKKSTKQTNK